MMQAILECKNLTKKFGRKTALDDVSLQLKRFMAFSGRTEVERRPG